MAEEFSGSILVTGGCFLPGYHIVTHLLSISLHAQISVFDLPDANPLFRFPCVTYYDVDLNSPSSIKTIISKISPQIIFHTLCTHSLALPASTHHQINHQVTLSVLSAAQSLNCVKAFVFHSSSSVIEDGTSDIIMLPKHFPKALAESNVLSQNRKNGILTASIRPAGTFGEADAESLERMIENAKSGKGNIQMGDGKNVFDFTYVGNLVHAHILAAKVLVRDWELLQKGEEIEKEKRVDGEVFHISNDEPWLFWEFMWRLAAEVGKPVKKEEIKVIPYWLGITMGFVAEWWVWATSFGREQAMITRFGVRYSCLTRLLDISKAKRVLGYRPLVGMEEAIKRSVAWYEEGKKTL